MTLCTAGRTLIVDVALIWVFFHFIGVAYVAWPLRTVGETLLISAVAALSYMLAGYLLLLSEGFEFHSVFAFGQYVLIGSLEYWLVMALVLVIGRWGHRRISTMPYLGRCLSCDYDLRGNETGVCPECGEAIQPDQGLYLSKLDNLSEQ